MKFLVLFACVAAAAAVELVEYPNGAVAPAKTPEVLAAEHAHFAAKGLYAGYPYGYAGFNGYNGLYNGAYAGAYNGAYYNGAYPGAYAGAYAHGAYPYHAGALVGYANGAIAPAKTPEVLAAEQAHFAAHGIAAPVHAAYPYAAGYPYAPLQYAGLVAHPNGAIVPVEPADVVAAREEHLAAHAAA